MKRDASFKLLIGVGVAMLFLGARYFASIPDGTDLFMGKSHIVKIPNHDASLSIPYLHAINRFWHVGGSTEIRNTEFIRLTKNGKNNDHGIIISNGIGDNTMNNLEVIVKFRISPSSRESSRARNQNVNVGDGMAVVIASDKDFVTQDLHSSYARRQYEINSGGVDPRSTAMMGFPLNLPGMALIIDTYQNLPNTRKIVPFMDAILNVSPSSQAYDIDSDGLRTSAIKLNDRNIRLKDCITRGDITKLRIIYLESINFLKVDIQYNQEGDYWIELFQKQDIDIPKNKKNGQRYVGVGALTGDFSETVDILDVTTNEFHWDDEHISNEQSLGFAQEMRKYLIEEYEDRILFETDDFQRWKMLKSQPNYLDTNNAKDVTKKPHSVMSISIAFCIFSAIIYLASVYIRVSLKHTKRSRRGILRI